MVQIYRQEILPTHTEASASESAWLKVGAFSENKILFGQHDDMQHMIWCPSKLLPTRKPTPKLADPELSVVWEDFLTNVFSQRDEGFLVTYVPNSSVKTVGTCVARTWLHRIWEIKHYFLQASNWICAFKWEGAKKKRHRAWSSLSKKICMCVYANQIKSLINWRKSSGMQSRVVLSFRFSETNVYIDSMQSHLPKHTVTGSLYY